MEREVRILKVLRKPKKRGYLVTIPKEVAEALGIEGGEMVKVLLDRERQRIIYQLLGEGK